MTADWVSPLFLGVAILVSVAVLFAIVVALRSWVFELSPREAAFMALLAFSLGILLTGYLDGDGTAELLGGLVIFLAAVWWIYRLLQRRAVHAAGSVGR